MSARAVVGVGIVLLLAVGGGVWKWRSELVPHYEKATVCGVPAGLVEDLVGTDRFVERYGFGRRCSAIVGGVGSEDGEVEFAALADDESSWPGRLRRVESSPHRISFNGGRAGYGRDGDLDGTWVCSRYWPGLPAISVWASSEIDGSPKAFEKVLRASADYAGGCAADPLDRPFETYAEPTACGMSSQRVAAVLGTRLFRSTAPDRLEPGTSWTCVALTDRVDGEVGSLVVSASVGDPDWEDEQRRIAGLEESFVVAGGQGYVGGSGSAGRAFWACDLGEDAGGGGLVTIGASGVSDRPVPGDDLRAMLEEVARIVGCGKPETSLPAG